MFKNILIAGSLTVMLACNNDQTANESTGEPPAADTTTGTAMNTLTEEEKNAGWELLFDGSTMNGWHRYGNRPVGEAWRVTDGTIHLDATNKENWKARAGDIVSDNEYENFELSVDWKVDTGANSGIIFYIHEDSTKYEWPWNTGMEMQVLDNERHRDAKILKHRAGDLYDLISCSKETVRPALEWNTAVVKSVNGKLDLFLNGENVVSTTLWDDNWKKMIAGSKFKDMDGFGSFKKGKIALQDHGDNVWYRNIKIRKL
jgi:hypothetical protein